MSAGVYTTTVTILGGSSQDGYGDTVEGVDAIATGVPMSINEGRQVVATEGQAQARTVRYYTGRAPHGLQVDDTQRIRDERTGDIYLIDNVSRPSHAAVPQDTRLDLRRVT